MFERFKQTVLDKTNVVNTALKAASNSTISTEVVTLVRSELTSVVSKMIFKYVIVMNSVFGVIGFVIGGIVVYLIK